MKKLILLFSIALLILNACEKQPEEIYSAPISDYSPLVVGKYITYQLDTFKFLPFSLKDTTVSYQVKHVVDGLITDNLGRPAYRILRYIRKTAQNAWVPDNSFMALNTGNSFEFVENNFRFVKLKLPIKAGFSWPGNSYINTDPVTSNFDYLANWDYAYDSINRPLILGSIHLDSTLKINQQDELLGNPANPAGRSDRNFGCEIYAKGIGLVYRKFLHTVFQPAVPGSPGYYTDDSYGVTLIMIDHN